MTRDELTVTYDRIMDLLSKWSNAGLSVSEHAELSFRMRTYNEYMAERYRQLIDAMNAINNRFAYGLAEVNHD